MIHSSAVLTRPNKTLYMYCVQHCSDWDIIQSVVELTIDTPYLSLMGELRGVFCEDLEVWRHRNGDHCIDIGSRSMFLYVTWRAPLKWLVTVEFYICQICWWHWPIMVQIFVEVSITMFAVPENHNVLKIYIIICIDATIGNLEEYSRHVKVHPVVFSNSVTTGLLNTQQPPA